MADVSKNIYWDSCVWISLINEEPGRVDICRALVADAIKGSTRIWTSSLSLAEVFKVKCGPTRVGIEASKDSDFENYVLQDFLNEVQLDHDVGVLARALLRQHPVLRKPTDAIHLASAAMNNVDELHTFDGDNLLALDGKVTRRDGKLLVICKPDYPSGHQTELYAGP